MYTVVLLKLVTITDQKRKRNVDIEELSHLTKITSAFLKFMRIPYHKD